MELNTQNKKKALKRTMLMLGQEEKLNRRKLCKILTKGNEPYKRNRDAKEFLKALVNSDKYPVERDENCLTRTDLKQVVS